MLYETLGCVGLNLILKYGSIFDLPRGWLTSRFKFFRSLFDCSLCLGFWCGVAGSGSLYYLHEDWNYLYYFFPLAVSLCSLTADVVIGTIKSLEMYLDRAAPFAPPSLPPGPPAGPCGGCTGEESDAKEEEFEI